MTEHETWNLISAFIDGELAPEERLQVEAHLKSCAACRDEAQALRRAKGRAAAAPRRPAPPLLIAELEARLARPSWQEALSALWRPRVYLPIGGMAAAALLVTLWIGLRTKAPEQYLPLEPLLAAHSRYAAESLIPAGDLVAANFSSQLTASGADEE